MEKEIKVSVRNIVEFILREGSISQAYIGAKRGSKGIEVHKKVQRKREKDAILNGEVYKKEYQVKVTYPFEDFEYLIEGRIDGVIIQYDSVTIEEIKSTYKPLDTIKCNLDSWHFAQAKCYGYMYMIQNELSKINIMVNYYNIETKQTLEFKQSYSFEELTHFFYGLIKRYHVFTVIDFKRINTRNKTAKELKFPYNDYRKGQRELSVAVYKSIKLKKNLFVKATTGTGKTVSTLFPSIKALPEGLCQKIFYLTAKNIAKEVAQACLKKMEKNGLILKSITITSKEKICLNHKVACSPIDCKYANGHFDRINDTLIAILNNETIITKEIVLDYSKKYEICPYELSLDVSFYCDVIICDYNYVYDPKVQLKRFFPQKGQYVVLNDEAHNLPERSRDMFSTSLSVKELKNLANNLEKNSNIYNYCYKIINEIINMYDINSKDREQYYAKEEPVRLYACINNFVVQCDKWLISNNNLQLLEVYFKALDFLRIYEVFDNRFIFFIEETKEDITAKLLCLDSSYLLQNTIKQLTSCIFFSATLTPINFYKNTIGGKQDDFCVELETPFNKNNLLVCVNDKISTTYKDRKNSVNLICKNLFTMVSGKVGNYFAFFPSYEYMNKVYDVFLKNYDVQAIVQQQNMTEDGKQKILQKLKKSEDTLLVFVVLGGAFGEGIDLVGDMLIGCAIVSVGLPMVNFERKLLLDYYNENYANGFEYAFTYPGINKVMQGGGRVIRSDYDKGVILLVDTRFTTYTYKKILPKEWEHYTVLKDDEHFKNKLIKFWDDN
jgi:DNA excision repair protein ERCC-2